MAQFLYDVVPHAGGWAILVVPRGADAFSTKQAAYDAAVEFGHKLRFSGVAMNVRGAHGTPDKATGTG
jgi:hypothetical protein